MSRDELRHLEHGHFALAAEDNLQLRIGENVALVGWVLEIVLLDVFPEFLHDLPAGHRSLAGDLLEFRGEGHRLHQGRICCSWHT